MKRTLAFSLLGLMTFGLGFWAGIGEHLLS